MRIEDLVELNLAEEMVDAWRAAGIEELTDIQERCLRDAALLRGDNTLIMAPTSAGKTFVGEVLAVRAAHALRRVLYVVPFKALAEEKYRYLREMYGPMGISVAVSSGDRDEFDEDIKRGSYLITVVVNEKLAQLLVQSPGIMSDCALVLIDEVQLIRDATRGPQLEMLLTRLLLADDRPQIVALSATVGALNKFDAWLRCQVIQSTERPVPLVEHAQMADGRLLAYDPSTRGVNQVGHLGDIAEQDVVKRLAIELISRGCQVLVFQPHVEETHRTAEAIANALPRADVPSALMASLRQLDDSETRSLLERCIPQGVAFHNAGLSFDERDLVESAFRRGHIKVLVSTTTLAVGVNLPADGVIIGDCRRWDPRMRRHRLIDVAEYKNCAGRAGRLGHANEGESFLVAGGADVEEGILTRFLSGTPEAIESAIPRSRLIEHVLSGVASRLASTSAEVHSLFEASFAAATFYREHGRAELDRGIEEALGRLSEVRLVDLQPSGQVRPTALGEVLGRNGVAVQSGALMISFLEECDEEFEDADVVFELCSCEELSSLAPYLRPEDRWNTGAWRDRVREVAAGCTPRSRLEGILSSVMHPNEDDAACLKRTCLALRWRNGDSLGVLTRDFRTGPGHVRRLGENLAWLLETMGQLAAAMSLPSTLAQRLSHMAQAMHHGVPFEAVPFARLRVRGLTRDSVIRLVRNETGRVFRSLQDALDASPADFVGIINPSLVPALQEAILRSGREGLRRQEAGLLVRARRLSIPEALIENLFESQGTDFEVAIENLLNAQPFNLQAARVTRQRAGQMDIHVPVTGGGSIVISAASSEDNAKPISWDKSREVLGAIGAPSPIRNFVVVGKPDFHQLAQENAAAIAQEPGRTILLLPVYVLGELCMRVFEGKVDRDLLLNVLLDQQGYLTLDGLEELVNDR